MHPTTVTSEQQTAEPGVAQFFQAIFAPGDYVLLRPIETWIENSRKLSAVDYKAISYLLIGVKDQAGNWHPFPERLVNNVRRQNERAGRTKANIFFGVCPRLGTDGRFDLAWQICVVRVLWTDIDHITVDEARQRVTKADVPTPSIIVNSGNGVHLYWLLDSAYMIDDVDAPPAVQTEWTQRPDGHSKPRRYFIESGDRVYLGHRQHVSRLSPKAEHIQDVLAGIAKALGGDHTIDLSRLLRVPGTLNRKDQRNGHEPVPSTLIECDPTRKYPLALFERLKSLSPESQRAKKIAAMPLPQTRKPSAAKADKLAELVAACAIAPAGSRSEADFAVCCYAIRHGIAKEDLWAQVQQVGKFAEQGRRYFDVTLGNAEYDVRAATLGKLQKRTSPKRPLCSAQPGAAGPSEAHVSADQPSDEGGDHRSVICIDTSMTPVGDTLHEITDQLLATGRCFSRSDQLVVVHGTSITPILASKELAGLFNQYAELFFVDEKGGEYKPLPANYGNTWLHQRAERDRLPLLKLFSRNPLFADDWRLVVPGYDASSGIYYAGPAVKVRDGTEHLDTLLQDFCFKTVADRTNYLGILLTALLVLRFVGCKPAVLFDGNQPGLGKSILAQIIAILRDGHPTETATYNPNDEEFEKRLGAIVRRGATTIIIDNAKGRGRSSRIESACLERSITDPVLSFRLLGYSAEIRAENSHIFCVTANTPEVSRDLVTRSVVISLYCEGDPARREFVIADPEDYAQHHRIELLGELIGMVERWKAVGMPKANAHSRFNKRGWAAIIGGILNVCGEPDFLDNAEEAAISLDETRREFTELVGVLVDHPQGTWTASELAAVCGRNKLLSADLGEGSPRSLATKMGTLAGRFVTEQFTLADGRQVVFQRSVDRKGNLYRVHLLDGVPNLCGSAEPLPNLWEAAGSAP